MATKTRASGRKRRQVSSESFFAERDGLIADVFGTSSGNLTALSTGLLSTPSPFLVAVKQLKQTVFVNLLHSASQENSPQAFKELLERLIHFLEVEIPIGVFAPMRKSGWSGRPIKAENEQIYSKWEEMGRPSPFKNDLAQAFYGPSFNKASGTERRKMRDKCRQAVDRHLDRRIAQLETEKETENARNAAKIAELQEQLARAKKESRGAKRCWS